MSPDYGGLLLFGNLGVDQRQDFGSYAMVDMSHPTVCKWELKFAASQIAACRNFHGSLAGDTTDVAKFTLHVFFSDATNTSIWQSAKLHGLFLTTIALESTDFETVLVTPCSECAR